MPSGPKGTRTTHFAAFDSTATHAAIIIIAAIAVFSQSLGHQFLASWDDYKYVAQNPDICGFTLQNLRAAFTNFYVGNYAPLHIVSYMADYTLWGRNPAGYIGANISLHVANALLFYFLVHRLADDRRVAFLSSFIFLVHPVQVESVVWISQRKNVLAMLFFLLSFIAYLLYRDQGSGKHRHKWYVLAVVTFLAALLTKSVAVVLPLVLVCYDLCFSPRGNLRQMFADKVPFVVAAVAVAFVTLKSQALSAGGGMVEYPPEGIYGLFLTMLTVFARYAGMLLWPANLSIYYYLPIKTGVDMAAALSGLLMVVLCGALFHLFKKNRKVFFWAILIPVGILPVSQIIPLSTLMNDRYLYFPMLGFAVLVSQGLIFCFERLSPRLKWVQVLLLIPIMLALPLASWQRSQVWHDSISLWSDALSKSQDFVTYAGMGNALYQVDRIDEAVVMYEKSLALQPTCEEALRCLGAIYLNRGQYDKALFYIEQFVEYFPDNAFGRNMQSIAYQQIGMRPPQ